MADSNITRACKWLPNAKGCKCYDTVFRSNISYSDHTGPMVLVTQEFGGLESVHMLYTSMSASCTSCKDSMLDCPTTEIRQHTMFGEHPWLTLVRFPHDSGSDPTNIFWSRLRIYICIGNWTSTLAGKVYRPPSKVHELNRSCNCNSHLGRTAQLFGKVPTRRFPDRSTVSVSSAGTCMHLQTPRRKIQFLHPKERSVLMNRVKKTVKHQCMTQDAPKYNQGLAA